MLSDVPNGNTPFSVAQASKDGDKIAQKVVDEIGHKLGIGIANYLNILDPGAVVLVGGVMSKLYTPVSHGIDRGIRENALSNVAHTPLIYSQYADTGAALGAALLFHPQYP